VGGSLVDNVISYGILGIDLFDIGFDKDQQADKQTTILTGIV